MRQIFLYSIVLTITGSLTAQNLVTGKTDFVGSTGFPTAPHLVEAGPNSFFWISGSSYSNVDHPNLVEVISDFANLYFLNYDKDGVFVSSNYLRGTNYATEAVSSNGGLTMMARASSDVYASGNIVSLNGANNMEFIVKYDRTGKFEKITKIWNLGVSESIYSQAKGDNRDGSMYVYGTGSRPLNVNGFGMIGELQSQNYLYVLKYSPDLQLEWVYTAGFDTSVFANGYYNQLVVSPDIFGNVVITGSYNDNCNPLFGNDMLASHVGGYGLFAVKLDATGNQVWVKEGSMNGIGNETHVFKGLAMKNGDLIMAGVTTTGVFKLGEVEVSIPDGSGFANQFVFRMGQDGTIRWLTSFNNMGIDFGGEQKDTKEIKGIEEIQSEVFLEQFYYDIIQWNDEVVYMCGSFLNDAFDVAGRILDKTYANGAFVVAVDLDSGNEMWGYGLSSDFVSLRGFDSDAGGNVSLMGGSSEKQDFEGLVEDPVAGTYPVFHVGLNFNGSPIWYNNAYLAQGPGNWLSGVDLEVLPGGDIFSSMYLSQTDNLMIGGSSLFGDYAYMSWLIKLDAVSELGGMVSDQSGSPIYPGYVNAYKSTRSGAFPRVDSVMLDDGGRYLFNGLFPGKYTFQAVPNAEAYPETIPTYLGDQVGWNVAQLNEFSVDTKANFLDIVVSQVPLLTPEDGTGVLSGFVGFEEEGTLKGTLAKPVKRASALVVRRPNKKTTNAGEVMAFVETDEFGNFLFENIPDGDYQLLIDIAGLDMIETHDVNITGNEIISGLDYTVGADGIYTWTGVGIPRVDPSHFIMFPNPGNGLLYMELPTTGDYIVKIYSTDGRLVATREYQAASGFKSIDISRENEGVYVIMIEGPNLTATLKYVKR